ncbi:MAG: hypothetical protein K6G33_01930 [Ruminococcus sp.]|uniref:hypothetical protein n=1 Tax=Ruminococcus sp. TaxID=41978 RepID=UPI0025E26973|nr:hypothetical protein [Ruminococcus sp.]MCR5599493.1 hypothetical protein [Ruminococcus sp.]
MCAHEFGIMHKAPKPKDIYVEYSPDQYDLIAVDDDFIQNIVGKLSILKCYWHTLERPELGLAYYGITLIPPESLEAFIGITLKFSELSELTALLSEAQLENKFVIHFGI